MTRHHKRTSLQLLNEESGQKISREGRIKVSKKAWIFRFSALIGYAFLIGYIVYDGLRSGNYLTLYSFIVPLSGFFNILIGWILYKNPATGRARHDELVSVIVPVYNQESMIRQVIDSLIRSTYRNIEIIAVNDGSTDGTKQILEKMEKSGNYVKLKVIHKKNEGKRLAVATAFNASKGKYLVMIDSDSIVDKHAIEEFMKAFQADPKVGGAVGHVKVVNSRKNLLTKFQDTWYDYSFNVAKSAESYFGAVICLSGCLAAYRREAIETFMPYWASAPGGKAGEDKEMTMYTFAPAAVKTQLHYIFGNKFWVPISQKLMEDAAKYDDSEDRILSAHSIIEWKNVFIVSAVAYTEVPEKIRQFCRQQIRWNKSFLRTNFFLNSFYWKKNPIASLHYYLLFMSTVTLPLLTVINFVYVPFILGNWLWTATYLITSMFVAFALGLDYKFRDRRTKNWMYKPLQLVFTSHFVSWLVIPAILQYRKDVWGTR